MFELSPMDYIFSSTYQLKMWEKFNEQCIKESKKEDAPPPERKLPEWLDQYIEYKFNLYDRTGV